MSSDEHEELRARIWAIRESIRTLERAKNDVLDLWASEPSQDSSTLELWIRDTKGVYSDLVAAWQMLSASVERGPQYAEDSRRFLEAAKSRLGQCISELRSADRREADVLASRLSSAFEICRNEIEQALKHYQPEAPPRAPGKRVIAVDERQYHLPCAVCGEVAVVFRLGIPRRMDDERLIFEGITKSKHFEAPLSSMFFAWLRSNRISDLHVYLEEQELIEDGIDAYCPRCDEIYCRAHYNVQEQWDAGFYDCAYGTCPAGHRRIIDD